MFFYKGVRDDDFLAPHFHRHCCVPRALVHNALSAASASVPLQLFVHTETGSQKHRRLARFPLSSTCPSLGVHLCTTNLAQKEVGFCPVEELEFQAL